MKQTIQTLKLGLAVLFLAMTSATLLAAPPRTGIQGQAAIYVSYGTPVGVEPGLYLGSGDVQLPVATTFSVLTARPGHRGGHLVGRFSTDASGAFNVSLPPGKYVIVPDTLNFGAYPFGESISTASFEVTVKPRKFTYALILYYQDGPIGVFATQTP